MNWLSGVLGRRRGIRVFCGDPHVHTTVSGGILRPSEARRQAAMCGLDFVGLTDHDTLSGSLEATALPAPEGCGSLADVVPGEELSCGQRVHMLILGVTRPVRCRGLSELSEAAEEVHGLGGVVVAAHPWTVIDNPRAVEALDRGLDEGWLDGFEAASTSLHEGHVSAYRRFIRRYSGPLARREVAVLASSDYHRPAHGIAIGLGFTCFVERGALSSPGPSAQSRASGGGGAGGSKDRFTRAVRRRETCGAIDVDHAARLGFPSELVDAIAEGPWETFCAGGMQVFGPGEIAATIAREIARGKLPRDMARRPPGGYAHEDRH